MIYRCLEAKQRSRLQYVVQEAGKQYHQEAADI